MQTGIDLGIDAPLVCSSMSLQILMILCQFFASTLKDFVSTKTFTDICKDSGPSRGSNMQLI